MSHRIEIIVITNIGNTQQILQKLGVDAKTAGASLTGLGANANAAVEGVKKSGEAAKQSGAHLGQFEKQTKKTDKTISGFGEKFAANRGIVFGIAGLSSALAEAVGMMGMLSDTQQRAGEAQAKLNLLRQQGVTTGQELAEAEAEVVKQNRFLNMVTRNTILSQMDMVFFSTMVVNGLLNNVTAMGKLKSAITGIPQLFGSIKTAFTGVAAAQTAFSAGNLVTVGTMGGVSTSLLTGTAGMTAFGGATDKATLSLKAFTAAAMPIAIVVASALFGIEVIREMEEVKKNLEAKGHQGMTLYELMFGDQEKAKAFINDGKAAKDTLEELDKTPILGNIHKGAKAIADPIKDLVFSLFPGLKKAVEDVQKAEEAKTTTEEKAFDIISQLAGITADYNRNVAAATPVANKIIAVWKSQGDTAEEMRGKIEGVLAALAKDPNMNEAKIKMIGEILNKTADDIEKGKDKIEVVYKSLGEAATAWANDQVFAADKIGQAMPAIEKLYFATGKSVEDTQAIVDSWIDSQADENLSDEKKIALKKQVANVLDNLKEKYGEAMTAEEMAKQMKEEMIKTEEAQMKIEEDRIKLLQTTHEQQAQVAADVKILDDTIATLNETFQTNIDLIGLDGQQTGILIDLANQVRDLYKEEEMALSVLAGTEGIHIDNLKEMLTNEKDETTELRNSIAARLDWNKALENSTEMAKQMSIGYLSGVQALQSFVQEQIQATAEQDVFRQGMEQLSHRIFPAIQTFDMTTESIQNLVEIGFKPAQTEGQKLAERMAGVQRAMEQLNGITQAESKKDFNKAWKELDLGAIPKKLRDDFKSIFKDIRKGNEDAREASTGLAMVTVALNELDKGADAVSLDEIHQTMDKIIDNFEAYAATGTDLQAHNLVMFEGGQIMDDLRNNTEKFKTTQMVFNDAMANGKMDGDDYINMLTTYLVEAGRWNEVTDENAQRLIDQGVFIDKNKNGINDLEEATKGATNGLGQFNDEMAQIEANAIVVDTISEMWTNLTNSMMEQNELLAGQWTLQMLSVELDAAIAAGITTEMFSQMVTTTGDNMSALSEHWADMGNNMAAEGEQTGQDIESAFSDMVSNVGKNMSELSEHWADMCSNMVSEAEAAASDISSELKSIPDEEVRINIRKVYVNSEGGIYSAAEGAVISARSGLTTSNGPTYLFGDNPGGRETMAFIPHNDPDTMMDILDAKFGRTKGTTVINTGNNKDIIVPITININGEQFSFTRKYRIQQGSDLAQQVF